MARNGILLRLTDELTRALDEADHLTPGSAPGGADFDELTRLLEQAGARSSRLVPRAVATPDRLRALEDTAIRRWAARERERGVQERELETIRRRRERRIGRSLAQYWDVQLTGNVDDEDITRVLKALAGLDVVEWAVRAPELVEAAVDHADEYYPDQRYLRPAPQGIDVEAAWDKGFSGAGLLLIDVERGWLFDHEDLPTGSGSLYHGQNLLEGRNHGTAVLGIVSAIDGPPSPDPTAPAQGVVGIAPDAEIRCSSRWDGSTEYDLVGAIIKAALHAPPPDVLLIEVQVNLKIEDGNDIRFSKFPVELFAPYWSAIWVATTLGVSVVEPAGNGSAVLGQGPGGGINLDEVSQDAALATTVAGGTDWSQPGAALEELDPTKPGFCDSGAIMVGAAYEAVELTGSLAGHRAVNEPGWGSNHGRRVDCYAWGENVRTTAGDGGYRGDFNGTSSASAIVAGAAVLVQEMHVKLKGNRASPSALRALLSDPHVNTRHVGFERPIGVMPDLKGIHRELSPWKFGSWLEWMRWIFRLKKA